MPPLAIQAMFVCNGMVSYFILFWPSSQFCSFCRHECACFKNRPIIRSMALRKPESHLKWHVPMAQHNVPKTDIVSF